MTPAFIDTWTKYTNQFTSSEDPMSFTALISYDTLITLMHQSLEENVPLTFGYHSQEGQIIPDGIFVKIGDTIVF